MKHLIFGLILLCSNAIAQISTDFESSDLSEWEMNVADRWEITDVDPIFGTWSLKHAFDNAESSNDQISLRFDKLHLNLDTAIWNFSVRYEYNPSSSNNWSAYLLSDQNAYEMHPDGNCSAYVVGVNFSGSDDLIKVWSTDEGDVSEIFNTDYNWQESIGPDTVAHFEILRYPEGTWELFLSKNHQQVSLGSFVDTTLITGNFFGFYYEYSSTQDRKLTLDDIAITGNFIPDTVPPAIKHLEVVDTCRIKITFSEPVNLDSLAEKNHYKLQQTKQPDSVIILGSDQVLLRFNDSFINETMYRLQVVNIPDLNDNLAGPLVEDFVFYQAQPDDILITEIHPDPLPVQDLPEYEYIELYNQSPYPINLKGWSITSSRTDKTLHAEILEPQQRLVLCHEDAMPFLSSYGSCMPLLTSLSSLLNTRDTIVVRDQYGHLIDSVNYESDWHDETKDDGGWSLELTNYERRCESRENWKSSINLQGGTPGQVNSVHQTNPDEQGPFIENLSFASDTVLLAKLNEPANAATLQVKAYQDELLTSTYEFIDDTSIYIYSNNLKEGTVTIKVENLNDLCFNTTDADSLSIYHHFPQKYEVIINEILVDPVPGIELPEYEFIELKNVSPFTINIKNWKISSEGSGYFLPAHNLNPEEKVILTHANGANDYAVHGKVLPIIGNAYFLANSGGSVTLFSAAGHLIDSLIYNPEWYESTLDGISLERIPQDYFCLHPRNLLPSAEQTGGTPGKENSWLQNPGDLQPVKLDKATIINDSAISVRFTDFIDTVLSASIAIEANRQISSLAFTNPTSLTIILSKTITTGDSIKISLEGLYDICGSELLPVEIELIGYEPSKRDLLVTEIMADPLPVQSLPEYEYVELYNNSPYDIDLNGWSLSVGETNKVFGSHPFSAGERLIVCHEDAVSLFSAFGNCYGLFTSISTLKNTNDAIMVRAPKGIVVDSLTYSDDLHDQTKNDGGWSLELTNIEKVCTDKYNWKSSVNTEGGTPGAINSTEVQNTDTIPPFIEKAEKPFDTAFFVEINEPVISDSIFFECMQQTFLNTSWSLLNDTIVSIQLEDPLTEGPVEIVFHSLTDQCYNTTSSDTISFYHHQPQRYDVVINEIMTDPSPSNLFPEYEYIELLNTSEFDISLFGWQIISDAGKYELPEYNLRSGEMVLLTHKNSKDDFIPFGETIPAVGSNYFLPNTNSRLQLLSRTKKTIDSLHYNSDYFNTELDALALERSSLNYSCSHPLFLYPSKNKNGGTPGKTNSKPEEQQAIPPRLVSASMISDTSLKINFDTFIDTTFLITISANHSIKNWRFEDLRLLTLKLAKKLSSGDTLKITIQGITGLCGETRGDIYLEFTTYEPDEFDLLITEIMADPEPAVELPNAEYIEVYNTTPFDIAFEKLTLYINDKVVALPNGYFKANSYSILVDDDDAHLFAHTSNVHAIPSLYLLNDQNQVVLKSGSEKIIHFASYSEDYFNTAVKKDGGWSLEMKSPENPCFAGSFQWKESTSYKGGTPGEKNTELLEALDQPVSTINHIGVLADTLLRIFINKYIPAKSIDSINVVIKNHPGGNTISFNENMFALDITLQQPLSRTKEYELQLQNVMDCMGNTDDSRILRFGLPVMPQTGDVLISEIMFDPEEDHPEFIEIYNASDKIIDVSDLMIRINSGNSLTMSLESQLFFPGRYLLISQNKSACKLAYDIPAADIVEIVNLGTMTNDAGYINVSNKQGATLDEMFYNANMHHHLLEITDGVSLERLSFAIASNEPSNWQSAIPMVEFSTPGSKNSHFVSDAEISMNRSLVIEPEVFSPNADGFNDILKIHYQLPPEQYTLNLTIYDASGRLVRQISRNEVISSYGTILWDGINDSREPASMGIYLIYFEAIGSNGTIIKKKETCVISR